jgi:hypothetical protein
MAKNEDLVEELNRLLEDFPAKLTLAEAQRALSDVVFVMGCQIVCKWGRTPRNRRVRGPGSHEVKRCTDPAVDLLSCSLKL